MTISKFRLGDEFAVTSINGKWYDNALATTIRGVSAFWSKDGKAKYSHTGVMSTENTTFEALWTYKQQALLESYAGRPIIVVRWTGCNYDRKDLAIRKLEKRYLGKRYPTWRLFLHLLGPAAKIGWAKRPVCSEITAMYEREIGASDYPWAWTTPDDLVDRWRKWDGYEIIFEGVL